MIIPDYIPKEISEHHNTKYWIKNTLVKDIPVLEFDVKIKEKFENIPVVRFKTFFISKITELITSVSKVQKSIKTKDLVIGFSNLLISFKKQIEDENILSNFKIIRELFFVFKSGEYNRTIKVLSGTSIYKAYVYIVDNIKKYLDIKLEDYSLESPEYNLFLKRKNEDEDLYIVHSKEPLDIWMMSSRSYWKSCQHLYDKKSNFKFQAIDSACDPEVSIVYLTNKKDFQNLGNEYIARCLLSIIRNKYTDEVCVLLSNFYGNVDISQFARLAYDEVQKHTDKKVLFQYNPIDPNKHPVNNFEIYDYYRSSNAELKNNNLCLRSYYSDIKEDTLNISLRNYSLIYRSKILANLFIANDKLQFIPTSFKERYFKSKVKHNILSDKFIDYYADYLDWRLLSECQNLSLRIVDKYIDRINFEKLSINRYLSKQIIQKYPEKFSSDVKLIRLKFSENELLTMMNESNIGLIFRTQTLSLRFILENKIIRDFLNTLGNKFLYIKKYQNHISNEELLSI